MGFNWSNNFPYSATIAPSMDDHVDPVNHTYFAGLHDEIITIENVLGLEPAGSYGTVRARLDNLRSHIDDGLDDIWDHLGPDPAEGYTNVQDKLNNHDHSGGVHGAPLVEQDVLVYKNAALVANSWNIQKDVNNGSCNSGFNYFQFIYGGPTERAAGARSLLWFNTDNETYGWRDVTLVTNQPRGSYVLGDIAYISVGANPGIIAEFNMSTWAEAQYTAPAGANYFSHLCHNGQYLYGACYTSPIDLIRYDPVTHTFIKRTLNAGEDKGFAIAYYNNHLYLCTDTSPVKFIKYNIPGDTWVTHNMDGITDPCTFMHVIGTTLWLFFSGATSKVVKYNLTNDRYVTYTPDWPANIKDVTYGDGLFGINFYNPPVSHFVYLNPETLVSYLTNPLSNISGGYWSVVNNGYRLIGDTANPYNCYIYELVNP